MPKLTRAVVKVAGIAITKLYAFESKSEEPIPNFDDVDAVNDYVNSGLTYGILMNRHERNIQEPPLVEMMREEERAERARFGY